MTGYASTPAHLAAIGARVALGKRIQPAQGRILLAEIGRLRVETRALRGVIAPQPDETGESFALSVRGVLALLVAEERATHRELRSLAQATVDAHYPGEHVGEDVATAISALSGWLADHPEAL